MRKIAFFLAAVLATAAVAAHAHAKPAEQTANPGVSARHAANSAHGIPPVHGLLRTAFSLKYQDYKIGAGPLAEPNKIYHVLYTGYLAATGQIFDSSKEHRPPLVKDGKPVMGPDGKPELGPPQPLVFPQGFGRLIPGFDQGFAGMRVGGKRRIFIPWQLGYGTRDIPARAGHPGIPPKSDLIFDVELLDVTNLPAMPAHPMGMTPHMPIHPAEPVRPATPPAGTTAPAANAPHAATQPN